jgi:hypothetical protein
MAWKVTGYAVGSPEWLELRAARDLARTWILDIAPLEKSRRQLTASSDARGKRAGTNGKQRADAVVNGRRRRVMRANS